MHAGGQLSLGSNMSNPCSLDSNGTNGGTASVHTIFDIADKFIM